MEFLTKAQILQAQDVSYEEVEVEEWGGTVQLRGWSGTQRDTFTKLVQKRRRGPRKEDVDVGELKAIMVSMSVVDEAGELLFSKEDVKALNDKSSAALDAVVEVIRTMNGLTADAVEQEEKN